MLQGLARDPDMRYSIWVVKKTTMLLFLSLFIFLRYYSKNSTAINELGLTLWGQIKSDAGSLSGAAYGAGVHARELYNSAEPALQGLLARIQDRD